MIMQTSTCSMNQMSLQLFKTYCGKRVLKDLTILSNENMQVNS